jgi:hypothetical protein
VKNVYRKHKMTKNEEYNNLDQNYKFISSCNMPHYLDKLNLFKPKSLKLTNFFNFLSVKI